MKTKTETLAQKALRLLSSVPSENFIEGEFSDKKGKCCAIGHYMRLTSKNTEDYSITNCEDGNHSDGFSSDIRKLSQDFLAKKYNLLSEDLSSVNNTGLVNGYKEPIIKDRVVHLLTDMVKEGF